MGEGQLPGEQAVSPESPEALHIHLGRLPHSGSSDMVIVCVPGLFLIPAVGSLVWSRAVCSVCCWMVALWAECWGTRVSHLHPSAGSRYPRLRINGVSGEGPAPVRLAVRGPPVGLQFSGGLLHPVLCIFLCGRHVSGKKEQMMFSAVLV